MSEGEQSIEEQIEQIEKEIDILNSQKRLDGSTCAICGITHCDVISFKHRKPVHSKCHILENQSSFTSK